MAKKKNSTGFRLALWILAVLVLLIVFLVKSDDIVTNLKETRFFERVFGSTPEFVKNHKIPEEKPESNNLLDIEVAPGPAETESASPEKSGTEAGQSAESQPAVPDITPQEKSTVESEKTDQQKNTAGIPEKKVTTEETKVSLCFVIIDADGTVSRKPVLRALPHTDLPLTDSMRALLAGPDLQESKAGCMSLIPKGTKLLSASVRDATAYLNFSSEFEFNTIGVEGYLGQLMQIVYTATSFATIDSVQILIDGEKKEYLGSEGVWIGSPLARSSFR
ncbi:MAG: GerMN domain-containing protein [Treponema sp.]|jgi:spore germination protein GerM|nr:GerMN domain-containing protein [Treponema sp.]